MMAYPGGKDGAGVWQRIINQIPPHDVFISAFAGDCAVARHILPARATVVIDRDAEVLRRWEERRRPETLVYAADAVTWLRTVFLQDATPETAAAAAYAVSGGARVARGLFRPAFRPGAAAFFRGLVPDEPVRVFVYCDPPYLPETLASRGRYRHMMTREDHAAFLAVIRQLPCDVLVHGYPSTLYDAALLDWRTFTFSTMTRGGLRTEQVWCNYQEPTVLHDYSQVGHNKRQRERIRRRCRNWRASLARAGTLERGAILQALMKQD